MQTPTLVRWSTVAIHAVATGRRDTFDEFLERDVAVDCEAPTSRGWLVPSATWANLPNVEQLGSQRE
jgi:hypothetical protein